MALMHGKLRLWQAHARGCAVGRLKTMRNGISVIEDTEVNLYQPMDRVGKIFHSSSQSKRNREVGRVLMLEFLPA